MKKIISLVLTFVMILSFMTVGFPTSAESTEFSKVAVDFDKVSTTYSGGGSSTALEVVNGEEFVEGYSGGKALKVSPAQWQMVYIQMPKNWKEGNPVGVSYNLTAVAETQINRVSMGISDKNSGEPKFNIETMESADWSGHLSLAAGEAKTIYFDLTKIDVSALPYNAYLTLKAESKESVFLFDDVTFYFATEDEIPADHNEWIMLRDFEDGDISDIETINNSGNESYGGYKALTQTDAYEGGTSLHAGKKCWDNSGATHFAKNFIAIPLDAETMSAAYSLRLKYKRAGTANVNVNFGVVIDGEYYWTTTGTGSTSWTTFDFLYHEYSAVVFNGNTPSRDTSTAFFLTPDTVKQVSAILVSAQNHYTYSWALVDNIEYAYDCAHDDYTVLGSYPVSCDEQAYELVKCNDCEKEIKLYDESTTALGHNWVKGNTIEATPSAPGYTEYTCTNGCGQTKQDDFTYAQARNHRFVVSTNQVKDDTENTSYNIFYKTLPTGSGDHTYNSKEAVNNVMNYVTDATYASGVGIFVDDAAGHCLTFGRTSVAVGNYIQVSFELEAGVYNFYTYARSHQGRGTCKVTAFANDETYDIQDNYKQDKSGDTGTTLSKNDLGYIVVPEKTTIDFKFEITKAGALFFKAFMFDSCSLADIPSGAKVTEIAAKKLDIDISMKAGASIRLNEKTGIRFHTVVDAEQIAALKAEGKTVTMGTIIAPADYVTDELTHELGEGKFADVKYESETYYEDNNTIVGSIVNIREKNIGREFIGRGYVCVDGVYYYAEMNNNSRSLKYIANALKSDANNVELYESFKTLVDAWADAPDWTK